MLVFDCKAAIRAGKTASSSELGDGMDDVDDVRERKMDNKTTAPVVRSCSSFSTVYETRRATFYKTLSTDKFVPLLVETHVAFTEKCIFRRVCLSLPLE